MVHIFWHEIPHVSFSSRDFSAVTACFWSCIKWFDLVAGVTWMIKKCVQRKEQSVCIMNSRPKNVPPSQSLFPPPCDVIENASQPSPSRHASTMKELIMVRAGIQRRENSAGCLRNILIAKNLWYKLMTLLTEAGLKLRSYNAVGGKVTADERRWCWGSHWTSYPEIRSITFNQSE